MADDNKNKALARRGIEEVWTRGDVAVAEELLASDFVAHLASAELHGPEGVTRHFGMLRRAFPDIRFTIEDQIAEGDRVATRWTARATHQGEFQGISPTGRPGVVAGITIIRVANGKVVEGWTSMDDLGLLQQLGVLPAPEQPQ